MRYNYLSEAGLEVVRIGILRIGRRREKRVMATEQRLDIKIGCVRMYVSRSGKYHFV